MSNPRPTAGSAPGPLDGLRVVEIGDEKGDYAGLLLAGLGAEVIKLEPTTGHVGRRIGPFHEDVEDPERSLYFWTYNRGKKSVALDLESAEGLESARGLFASADIVLDSTDRGTLKQLGLEPDIDGGLIHARLTPFGDTGPWADMKSSDLVSLALGGITMNCGYDPEPDGFYDIAPIAPQVWHSYHIAGEQLAIGIVAALLYRQETGEGQQVSVAIHEALAKNTELDVTNWIMLRQPVYRQTCRHAKETISDPSISYTKDGRWLLSMSMGNRDLSNLGPFLSKYGIDAGIEAKADEVELTRPIGGSTANATKATEIIQRLTRSFAYDRLPWREAQEAGLLWSPVRKPHENVTDDHWIARSTFVAVEHPEIGKSIHYPVSKWLSTAGSWAAGRRAPLLGEDNDEVLSNPARLRSAVHTSPRHEDRPLARSAAGTPFPLQGVRVLDFTWFLASAGATRFLAALGADVIKVEWKTHPDTGRGQSNPEGGRAARDRATEPLPSLRDPRVGGQFNNKNPGKRGLSLNVADPRGLEIAKALVEKCDIVAEGFTPGVFDRWGFGYDVLRSIRSDIIYVQQSGMGAVGTYGRFRSLGPIAAAFSGVSDMSGLPEPAQPAGWGYSYLDWFAAYSMALSVTSALYHRNRTGEGQWIDASQAEAGIFLTGVPVADWSANGRAWQRYGNRSPYKPAAPHGIYRCAGIDRWIAISAFTDSEWEAVAQVAQHPEWLRDSRFATLGERLRNQDALDAVVESWTSQLDAFGLMDALQRAGVAAGVCQNAQDKYETDPQLAHLGWLTELNASVLGTWPVGEVPIRMSVTPPHVGGLPQRGAPLYGEDNEAVLSGLLGLSLDEIAKLTEAGVL
ncbi:CaiB/BaiF CoA-transferase family protein [Rhodococcus rhodochrous]|uniref:CaiB/BaiF CoA-transferase family protein n=1 Tax=Rhodococcus rhodochrous TaxID=1829 RepID=UPI0009B68D15|nr:CoA transferase [Rhodococcus rhodochrous]